MFSGETPTFSTPGLMVRVNPRTSYASWERSTARLAISSGATRGKSDGSFVTTAIQTTTTRTISSGTASSAAQPIPKACATVTRLGTAAVTTAAVASVAAAVVAVGTISSGMTAP